MQMSNHSDWERITPFRQFNFNMYATEFQDSLQVIFLILYAMMWTLSIAPARSSLLYQDFRKIAISIVSNFLISIGFAT